MDRKINYISFTTAAAYALVAGLWVVLSDRLLGTMIESTELLTKIQQYKGWGFVLVTAVLLYTLLRRQIGEYRKALIAKHDLDIQQQEMEEKAAGYFEVSPVVGYVLVVKNNKIEPIWVSENIGDVLGISGRAAEQSDFWEEILRKDRLEVEKVQETEKTVSRAGYYKREYRLEDDQGNVRWVQDIYRIHPAGEGVPGKMIGVLMDISDRTNEESQKEKFFQAMGNTIDLVFVTDREGVIEYVNPAFEELTGFSAEEAIGKTASILDSGEMEDDFYADFWRKILGGEVVQVEVINQTKTGRRFIYEQTVTPVYDDLGKITHFVSTGRDTTERRELLIQIKARNLELAALNAISAESIGAKSSAEILPLIVREAKRLLRADAAGSRC
jgi:PAS domain S-box-containing protein